MKKLISIFCISILLSGCMSFNNRELPVIEPPLPPKTKPVIEMKVGHFIQKLNGEGASRGLVSNKSTGYMVLNAILGTWQNKKLISEYDTIGDLHSNTLTPNYTLTLNGFRNEDMSWLGSFFCGLTLFIIPNSFTMEFDLNFELKDNKTGKVYFVNAKNSSTTWTEILLLPAFPVFWLGNHNMFVETSMYTYSKFSEQGAFDLNKKVSNKVLIKNIMNDYKENAKK